MIYYLLFCYIRNAGYLCDGHNEILALHKESRECVWLRSMIEHIEKICNFSFGRVNKTIFYKYDTMCSQQICSCEIFQTFSQNHSQA